ncbi:hypothetical protein TH61_03415 [Rufibacter sp. DG15C]|uniref:DUF4112 domain-containing protein n=1 Tax=Rufibacter sp. DG15C TaxID=1379909 RepID=UPI00078C2C93|nr:DUF4112 domain-containing protein [Rufibacter sp. DG15C]AMM50423.1 hypothetical protein TH61_03415 [Rufibacter sp. DG15C]
MNTPPQVPLDDRLKWVESVARLLDNQFKVPGTNFRFGVDPLLNLIPVVGSLSTFAMSGVMVMTMARHGASGALVVRMLFNILLDAVVGAIPVLGWLFDFGYKANQRNVDMLRRHYVEGKYQGRGTGFVVGVLLVFLVLFGLVLYGIWQLFAFGWEWVSTAF